MELTISEFTVMPMLPQYTVLADLHPGLESDLAQISDLLADMKLGKISDSGTKTIQINLVIYKAFFSHPSQPLSENYKDAISTAPFGTFFQVDNVLPAELP